MLKYAVVIHCDGKRGDGSPCDESIIYECQREPGTEELAAATDAALQDGWAFAHKPPGKRVHLCRWCARWHFAPCVRCGQQVAEYCYQCCFDE